MCPSISYPSWIRGVFVEGTRMQYSQSSSIPRPSAPVNPTVMSPRARAAVRPRTVLEERPEVDRPIKTSPSSPSASIYRAKM